GRRRRAAAGARRCRGRTPGAVERRWPLALRPPSAGTFFARTGLPAGHPDGQENTLEGADAGRRRRPLCDPLRRHDGRWQGVRLRLLQRALGSVRGRGTEVIVAIRPLRYVPLSLAARRAATRIRRRRGW